MSNNIKFKKFFTIIAYIAVFSYLFNFVWESFHSVYLYNLPDFSLKEFISLINHVSSVDALMITGIYFIISLLFRDFIWIENLNFRKISTFIGVCLIFALWVEYRGVFLLKKWSYSHLMPTIFGFGLSPLIQLFTTGIIAILFINKLTKNNKRYKK